MNPFARRSLPAHNKFTLITLLCCLALPASADFAVNDVNLNRCVNKLAAKNGWATAQDVTEIKCHNKKVASVDGLEQFTQLQKLSLYKNRITTIDVSHFPKLKQLNIAGNLLSALDVSQKPDLESLFAFHNPMQALTITNCPSLKTVKANNARLVSFTTTLVPNLEKLYLFDNQLEIIEIDPNGTLRYLDVRHNPMPDEFYDYLDSLSGLTSLHDGNAEDWE